MNCLKITLKGLVQGVGMRPFIFNLAKKFDLKGEVYNDDSGVKITICGEKNALDIFLQSLQNSPPPLARIDEIITQNANLEFQDFRILDSKKDQKIAPILPDFAICDECEREFNDPQNRRYHHAFINCTHCGPRFSIISSLPYDRKNTSMRDFAMCDACKSEYENPLDRRFHAQPICCKDCGPKAFLRDLKGGILEFDENAFKECAKLLENGKIIAVKGLGGFHLCCDATNENAIKTLRERKNRPHKPLALMCQNLEMIKSVANPTNDEIKILCSNIRPIVLAQKNPNFSKKASEQIAPKIDKIGVFLAPTSFNLLLFYYFKKPLIATSANISAEPIITDYNEICARLSSVCDFVLDHERPILHPSDDSVVFCADLNENLKIPQFLRMSRALRPLIKPFKSPKNQCILALGAELKNTFAIYKNNMIFRSPYIGDLKNIATFKRFLGTLEMFKGVYELSFNYIIGDLHPHFTHTRHFEALGFEVKKLQHHKAHVYSVMSEHKLAFNDDIIAFAFDGTGYGEDGVIWGGEVFANSKNGLSRILHFDDFSMIGAENSIKNIYFLAYAILQKYDIKAPEFYEKFSQDELKKLEIGLKLAKFKTTSLGRIFDALGCVALGLNQISFDAQAPMLLESFYDKNLNYSYEFSVNDEIISFKGIFENALKDKDPRLIATGFINALADLILKIALKHGKKVILCGGCFGNKALLERSTMLLAQNNLEFYISKNESSGDECIANGELFYALNTI